MAWLHSPSSRWLGLGLLLTLVCTPVAAVPMGDVQSNFDALADVAGFMSKVLGFMIFVGSMTIGLIRQESGVMALGIASAVMLFTAQGVFNTILDVQPSTDVIAERKAEPQPTSPTDTLQTTQPPAITTAERKPETPELSRSGDASGGGSLLGTIVLLLIAAGWATTSLRYHHRRKTIFIT